MQRTHLVLGIGDESKPVLKRLENDFPFWQFATLDCWSQVPVIKIVDEEVLPDEDLTARFVTNLSYFIQPPQVALRFDNDKYEDAETQEIVRYPPHYRKLVKKERQTRFSAVFNSLEGYAEILIVSPTSNAIALEWLLPLVKSLENSTNIRIFSWYPFMLEGRMKTEMAATLSYQLMDTQAKHYCFFRQDIVEQYKNETVVKILTVLENMQQQAVRSLLSQETITDFPSVSLL